VEGFALNADVVTTGGGGGAGSETSELELAGALQSAVLRVAAIIEIYVGVSAGTVHPVMGALCGVGHGLCTKFIVNYLYVSLL
jgi:hypothetical protein